MTHRRLRPLLSGLVLIALTVTACATTITGTGRALPPPAPPNPLLRTDGHTALGDLVTGDLCAGIPLSAFRQWGSASRHGWQSADACYLDIALPDGGEFQLDTWAEDLQSFYPGNSTTTAQSGNASIRAFPQADGDCERALVIGTIAFETHVEKLDELPSGAVQCATTDRYAHLELAALAGRHLTPRSLASPSLTRYDLCALMSSSDMGHVDFLSNSAGTPMLEGGGCWVRAGAVELTVRIAFVSNGFPIESPEVVVAGRRLKVGPAEANGACEVVAERGQTYDSAGREILDLEMDPTSGHLTGLCAAGEKVVTGMLDAAHLH